MYKGGVNPVVYCLAELVGSQTRTNNSNLWPIPLISTFEKKFSKLSKASKCARSAQDALKFKCRSSSRRK